MPGNTVFHPTIKTMGFQTAFSVNTLGFFTVPEHKIAAKAISPRVSVSGFPCFPLFSRHRFRQIFFCSSINSYDRLSRREHASAVCASQG
jgi:hypothetical protein